MSNGFPGEGMELTHILVSNDTARSLFSEFSLAVAV